MLSSSNAGWYLLGSGSASQTLLCAKAATQSGRTMGLPSMSASISCGRVNMHSDHHGMQRRHGAAHTRGNASRRGRLCVLLLGAPGGNIITIICSVLNRPRIPAARGTCLCSHVRSRHHEVCAARCPLANDLSPEQPAICQQLVCDGLIREL